MVSPWHLALYTVRTGSRRIRRIGGENEISFAWYRVSHLLLLSVMHLAHRIVSCTRHRLSSRHGIVGGVRRGSNHAIRDPKNHCLVPCKKIRLGVSRSLGSNYPPRPAQRTYGTTDPGGVWHPVHGRECLTILSWVLTEYAEIKSSPRTTNALYSVQPAYACIGSRLRCRPDARRTIGLESTDSLFHCTY